jgi:hypothetical protein
MKRGSVAFVGGCVFGAIVGGSLSLPNENGLTSYHILTTFPFLLPCTLLALLQLFGVVLVAIVLQQPQIKPDDELNISEEISTPKQ